MKRIITALCLALLSYGANAGLVAGGEVYYRHTFGGGSTGYNYTNVTSVKAYGSYGGTTVELEVTIIRCLHPGWEFCPKKGDLMPTNPSVDDIASANLETYAYEQIAAGTDEGTAHKNYLDPVTNMPMPYTLNWLKDDEGISIQVKRDGLELQ
ncbi:MAG: hypothetical protein V4538_09585 [Bacteroidota bacterium]